MPVLRKTISISRLTDAFRIIISETEPDGRVDLEKTPLRAAKGWLEQTNGYTQDPIALLGDLFPAPSNDMIVERNIKFSSLCEHHLMPVRGIAHIGMIPNGSVPGLSKYHRLVDAFAHRLQLQERVTSQIADTLNQHSHPRGVAVMIVAEHSCVDARGVCAHDSETITVKYEGLFETNSQLRHEFLQHIYRTSPLNQEVVASREASYSVSDLSNTR